MVLVRRGFTGCEKVPKRVIPSPPVAGRRSEKSLFGLNPGKWRFLDTQRASESPGLDQIAHNELGTGAMCIAEFR
jgi:hypothetical protein